MKRLIKVLRRLGWHRSSQWGTGEWSRGGDDRLWIGELKDIRGSLEESPSGGWWLHGTNLVNYRSGNSAEDLQAYLTSL